MTISLHVHLLPELCSPEALSGGTTVVIDILRASTTICHALAAGASRVIPCLSIEDAQQYRSNDDSILLGGERGGTKIEGFDLDNSPLAYTPEVVAGKTIAFTTTNGTKALHRCRHATEILIGAFSNLNAVSNHLERQANPIHLLCAGTNGEITGEDVLFAGAVVSELQQRSPDILLQSDSTKIAIEFWNAKCSTQASLLQAMLDSQGGRNLQSLGLTHDVERACERNLFDFVPVWNQTLNAIEM